MEPQSTQCPSCGSSVPTRTFCRDCGARLTKKTCRSCGNEVDGHSRFCAECGETLRTSQTAAASAPGVPPPPVATTQLIMPPAAASVSAAPWLTRGASAPTGGPPMSGEQWMAYSAPPVQQPSITSIYPAPQLAYGTPPPVAPPTHGSPGSPSAPNGRIKAAAKAIGALLALTIALFFCAGASGYFMGEIPEKEDLGAAIVGITLAAYWLGGGIWLGKRASWSWAGGFLLCWPVTLPLYVYKAARGQRSVRPSFPTLVSFGAIAAVTALLFIGGAAFSSNPVAPQKAEAESGGRQEVAAVDEATSTSTAEPKATEATDTPKATRTPKPTKTATAEPTNTPKPTKTATAKPTSTPKPKVTKTARPRATSTSAPVAEASYDPRTIARDLRYEEIRYSEDAAFGYGITSDVNSTDRSVLATIGQTGEFGVILYLVFETDADALEYVLDRRSGYEWSLPDYPGYITATGTVDGSSLYLVAVGNVVVAGGTDYAHLRNSYVWDGTTDRDVMAAILANFGVMRVERLGGDAQGGGSSGNTL